MTEQDYTDIEDKVRVSNALKILTEIVPENSQVIKDDELRQVIRTLSRWQTALFKALDGKINVE